MKKIFLTVLAAGALQLAASAQTNSTGNSSGQMNNTGTGANTGTMPNDGSTTSMQRGDASATIGGMSRAEFDRMNEEGARKVAAITPTSTPLSKGDQKLLVQMAEGGLMQLRVSMLAVGRVQRDDVKVLAQGEVEEQTIVSQKIMEIARAKGMTLDTGSTEATTQMLDRILQLTKGAELDEYYTRKSGINGHEKLMKTGEKVMREAQDPALKALAAATAPVIKMHMQVSQGVVDQMANGESNRRVRPVNSGR